MMRGWMLGLALATGLVTTAMAAPPAAIFTDPPADPAHPARMEVLAIPTGGVKINAIAYVASGPGPHPVMVLLHGLPGNEKNLDLAQAVRRAGWTVIAPNYRGSWGSPGPYSFRGNIDDARAVLAYVRGPDVAAKLGLDTKRIVLFGHSMGGWVTSQVAASDTGLIGAIMMSAANMGPRGGATYEQRLQLAKSNMESLATTAEAMAQELGTLNDLSFDAAASGLAKQPLLVLTSDDGLAPPAQALATDVKARGGKVTAIHVATDHGWNTARIRLETEVLNWLETLK